MPDSAETPGPSPNDSSRSSNATKDSSKPGGSQSPPSPSNSSSTSPPSANSKASPASNSSSSKSPQPSSSPSPPPPSKDSVPPPPSDSEPPPAASKSPTPPPPATTSPPPPASPSPPPPKAESPPPPSSSNSPVPSQKSPPPPGNAPPPPVQSTSPTPPQQASAAQATSPSPPPLVPVTSSSPPPPSSRATHSPQASSPPPSSSSSRGGSSGSNGSHRTSDDNSGGSHARYVVAGVLGGALIVAFVVLFFVVRSRKKRRTGTYGNHFMPPSTFSVKSDGYYYREQQGIANSSRAETYYSSQTQHSHTGNSSGSQRGQSYTTGTPDSGIPSGSKTIFSYEDLMEITNGFSRQNVIGEGGFGCVYKACVPDGRTVAVKQLKAGSGQGEREFRAEVDIISRVHHRHLVSLVGYCISEQHRLLIYEFVPNQTLEHHLHGKDMPALEWAKRVKIALGAAKGLAYLHEDCHPKIIHRDIKSANILLDNAFEAQVADFGLAKLNDSSQTHVSTRVMGTFGYLAPEYASSGKLTDRSDVFSFGVVLLELITGRKPVDASQPLGDESLVEWARPHLIHALETGDFSQLVDPRLEKHYLESEVSTMIEAAAACVRHSAGKRPRMAQVVRALDSEAEMSDLSNGVRYGQSTAYDSGQYNQDILRFRRMALGDDLSSEYEEYSGEYSSREVHRGHLSSGRSGNSSIELTSGDSETRAINTPSSEQGHSGFRGNYRGRRVI